MKASNTTKINPQGDFKYNQTRVTKGNKNTKKSETKF